MQPVQSDPCNNRAAGDDMGDRMGVPGKGRGSIARVPGDGWVKPIHDAGEAKGVGEELARMRAGDGP